MLSILEYNIYRSFLSFFFGNKYILRVCVLFPLNKFFFQIFFYYHIKLLKKHVLGSINPIRSGLFQTANDPGGGGGGVGL